MPSLWRAWSQRKRRPRRGQQTEHDPSALGPVPADPSGWPGLVWRLFQYSFWKIMLALCILAVVVIIAGWPDLVPAAR